MGPTRAPGERHPSGRPGLRPHIRLPRVSPRPCGLMSLLPFSRDRRRAPRRGRLTSKPHRDREKSLPRGRLASAGIRLVRGVVRRPEPSPRSATTDPDRCREAQASQARGRRWTSQRRNSDDQLSADAARSPRRRRSRGRPRPRAAAPAPGRDGPRPSSRRRRRRRAPPVGAAGRSHRGRDVRSAPGGPEPGLVRAPGAPAALPASGGPSPAARSPAGGRAGKPTVARCSGGAGRVRRGRHGHEQDRVPKDVSGASAATSAARGAARRARRRAARRPGGRCSLNSTTAEPTAALVGSSGVRWRQPGRARAGIGAPGAARSGAPQVQQGGVPGAPHPTQERGAAAPARSTHGCVSTPGPRATAGPPGAAAVHSRRAVRPQPGVGRVRARPNLVPGPPQLAAGVSGRTQRGAGSPEETEITGGGADTLDHDPVEAGGDEEQAWSRPRRPGPGGGADHGAPVRVVRVDNRRLEPSRRRQPHVLPSRSTRASHGCTRPARRRARGRAPFGEIDTPSTGLRPSRPAAGPRWGTNSRLVVDDDEQPPSHPCRRPTWRRYGPGLGRDRSVAPGEVTRRGPGTRSPTEQSFAPVGSSTAATWVPSVDNTSDTTSG